MEIAVKADTVLLQAQLFELNRKVDAGLPDGAADQLKTLLEKYPIVIEGISTGPEEITVSLRFSDELVAYSKSIPG